MIYEFHSALGSKVSVSHHFKDIILCALIVHFLWLPLLQSKIYIVGRNVYDVHSQIYYSGARQSIHLQVQTPSSARTDVFSRGPVFPVFFHPLFCSLLAKAPWRGCMHNFALDCSPWGRKGYLENIKHCFFTSWFGHWSRFCLSPSPTQIQALRTSQNGEDKYWKIPLQAKENVHENADHTFSIKNISLVLLLL